MCGPGCQLKLKLANVERFAKFLGLLESCNCDRNAAEMDKLGTQWCRANVDKIIEWMTEANVGRVAFEFFPVWTTQRLTKLILEACDEADKEKSAHETQAIRQA